MTKIKATLIIVVAVFVLAFVLGVYSIFTSAISTTQTQDIPPIQENENNTQEPQIPTQPDRIYFPIKSFYRITSQYGDVDSAHPASRPHTGIDFACEEYTPIYASAPGIAEVHYIICEDRRGEGADPKGYGNWVKINHGNGTYTIYGHCSIVFAHNGQKIDSGQKIASVGSTGNSTGYHLHFGVDVNGKHIDPIGWLLTQNAERLDGKGDKNDATKKN